MTRVERIKDFLLHGVGIHGWNVGNAKYYGATFYSATGWDGAFEYNAEDAKRWEYIVDLSTGIIKKNGRVVALDKELIK